MQHMDEKMRDCAQTCARCRAVCLETIAYCLGKGGPHADPAHLQLLMDCAEICATSSGFLSRASTQHAETCAACAVICDACAESCEAMGSDAQMTKCAKACRDCAESCRTMSA